jgi:uncharacterized 2Fe-2S/4Fe-4S cluster protein (DUF4445 family)
MLAQTQKLFAETRIVCLPPSSPTGPAFEGAQISSGQRAAPGAIERIRVNPETLEPRFRVIGVDLWSDEDGFDAAIAQTWHHWYLRVWHY